MRLGWSWLSPVVALAALGSACAHGDASEGGRTASAQAQGYLYTDDRGLRVYTVGAVLEEPVSEKITLSGEALVDRVLLDREAVGISADGSSIDHTHHDDQAAAEIDVVTSASVSVTGGDRLEKTRIQGVVGLERIGSLDGAPASLGSSVRVSAESDYRSYALRVGGSVELAERTTTLSGSLGAGYDTIDPTAAPAGERSEWPASHRRVSVGAAITQVVNKRWLVAAGVSGMVQEGTLSSPYRRAVVVTSLFPERLPRERARFTGFVSSSLHLGWATALHLRQGAYADSWGVEALIPEATVVKEVGALGLLALRYRYYRQSSARFHQRRYEDLLDVRSGDVRLGELDQHRAAVEVTADLIGRPDAAGYVGLQGSYARSVARYFELSGGATTAHIVGVGLGGVF